MPEVYPENIGMSSGTSVADHSIPAGRGRDDEMNNQWRAKWAGAWGLLLARVTAELASQTSEP